MAASPLGVIFNYMGAAVNWHEMPGIIYIGHFRDVKPQFKGKEAPHSQVFFQQERQARSVTGAETRAHAAFSC